MSSRSMSVFPAFVLAAALAVLAASGPVAAQEQARAEASAIPAPEFSTEALGREEWIARSLAAIEAELAAHGGTWEAWAEDLAPYREDIRDLIDNAQKYEWPWPAEHDQQFQGQSLRVHLMDGFGDFPDGYRPLDALRHLNRQLRMFGIDMIVAIIPAALSVYPDYLYAAVPGKQRPVRAPEDRMVSLATRRLLHQMLQNDIEVVDLHKAFADFRRKHGDGDDAALYPANDSHYSNLGARLSAARIAERLMRYDFVRQARRANPYVTELIAGPGGSRSDANVLLVKDRKGHAYRDRRGNPWVLLIGDSHFTKQRSSGAHVSAQVARLIGLPVTTIWQAGLSSMIPVKLAGDRMLRKRKVVVLHYTERMMSTSGYPGKRWPVVDLPGAREASEPVRAEAPRLEDFPASAVVVRASPPPDPAAPYAHYVMKFYVKELGGFFGKVGEGDGVLLVLAMHNRKVLPVAAAKPGRKLQVKLTSWPLVEEKYGSLQAGSLDDIKLELEKPLYWAELPDTPSLTAEDLRQAAEGR